MTRWWPVLSMMLVSMISYVDRSTLAILAPTILRETGMNAEQYGFVVSAFSIAYMLGNPLWGVILDRIGTRRGMLSSVGLWTLASVSHVFAGGFAGFATARALLGFGEGATFPGAMRTSMQTLPIETRSRGVALSYSGGALGAILTPLIVTPIALRWGWRGAFWFTGAIGTLWLVHWFTISRRPELSAIAPLRSPEPGKMLNFWDAKLWAFIAAYALGALPLGFVLNNTSLYLSSALHKSQSEIGAVLWLPPLGWESGYFFWGWFTDRYLSSGRNTGAMGKTFAALAGLSLILALVPRIESFALTMLVLSFMMFIAGGFIIGSLAYANSHYPLGYAGLIAGAGAGSWSAMVALVMPFMGRLFDQHQHAAAFVLVSLFPIFGLLIWVVLDRVSAAQH